ncbi:NAD(P)-dependent oxidoreductase [Propionibacteriaceae bacterium G57]|uniref:NAD(P)-dependent oxidoreductase n=1 Tax=Aestuariimicrobium sp. G57 TaxID=3418485 RepID=UPI003DA77D7F
MRLTVIGSTGRVGRHLVAQALTRSHTVTATTRRPGSLAPADHLTVVTADGTDLSAMRRAVYGADAVVAIISAPSQRGPHQAAAVARGLTHAMADVGARRLVMTSAYPIVGERPRIPIMILRALFAASYADARAMEAHLDTSELDWTIVRFNRLTDGPATGRTVVTPALLDNPAPLSRSDAAAVLLDIATGPAHARTALNVAGTVGKAHAG